jgi:UDP-N-acetylglucosamine:LPS N-acetylglucosamine transferase
MDGSEPRDIPAVIHSSNQVMHPVWKFFHSFTKCEMALLEKVLCQAVRLAFECVRTTPKNVLAEGKISPIILNILIKIPRQQLSNQSS